MLVLSRKVGEVIEAGDVRFHVLGFKGGRIRIGIEAPDSVNIRRMELPIEEGEFQTPQAESHRQRKSAH